MRNISLTLALLFLFCSLQAQKSHKASKAEADFCTKVMTTLNGALPENYKNWDRNLLSEDEGELQEGSTVDDCKGGENCDLFLAPCIYSAPYNDPTQAKFKAEIDAITATDKASLNKKDKLSYRLISTYGLTLKLMANFGASEYFDYCQPGGYQKLTPPAGWDAQYFGSMENCFSGEGYQQGDIIFLAMGQIPTIAEKKVANRYRGTPVFPLNPALTGKYKVQNIVLYIQGSKELVADFVKNMNTAALRALIDK